MKTRGVNKYSGEKTHNTTQGKRTEQERKKDDLKRNGKKMRYQKKGQITF